MSVFGDYKAYKKFRPQYTPWKEERRRQEEKRLAYLKNHPELIKDEDIQRGKTLLKAVDVLDEYSQTAVENTEVTTEIVSQELIGAVSFVGSLIGLAVTQTKPIKAKMAAMMKKSPTMGFVAMMIPTIVGGMLASLAAFPVMSWAARTETGASRKGRLDAMQTKLQNPNNFAVLNEEQLKKVQEESSKIKLSKDEMKPFKAQFSFKDSVSLLKNALKQEKLEQKQQDDFRKLINEEVPMGELTGKALEKAKRDKQVLTNLVEQIDISSQDYSENVELATTAVIFLSPLIGTAVGWLGSKLNNLLKIKPDNKIAKVAPWALGVVSAMGIAMGAASVQKQASRVGRFNVRQEFAKNPEKLIYVDDDKVNAEIKDSDVTLNEEKKPNFFKFLWKVFKDNQAYKKYQKTQGLEDKKFNKALDKIELTEEQLEEAKVLQRNTFKTFNKVDEMSQKYSENVEAVGKSVEQPLGLIFSSLGALAGFKYLMKIPDGVGDKKTGIKNMGAILKGFGKYALTVFVSYTPVMAYEFYVTKQQKEASRIANMLAIKELDDVKNYGGYKNG